MEGQFDMKTGFASSKRIKFLSTGLLLVVSGWVRAQQPAANQNASHAGPKAIALVSDQCPVVQRGGRISLDWNPNFDQEGAVSGLRGFQLIFRQLDEDGVHFREQARKMIVTTAHTAGALMPLGNGFYHIELTVPRTAGSGVYRLVGAGAFAAVYPEYKDMLPQPLMTDSPVRTRLCVTVVKPQPANPADAMGPAGAGN